MIKDTNMHYKDGSTGEDTPSSHGAIIKCCGGPCDNFCLPEFHGRIVQGTSDSRGSAGLTQATNTYVFLSSSQIAQKLTTPVTSKGGRCHKNCCYNVAVLLLQSDGLKTRRA